MLVKDNLEGTHVRLYIVGFGDACLVSTKSCDGDLVSPFALGFSAHHALLQSMAKEGNGSFFVIQGPEYIRYALGSLLSALALDPADTVTRARL